MKITTQLIITMIIISILLSSCSPKSTDINTTPIPQQSNSLIAEGRVQPAKYLEHSFNIPGQIAEVLVTDGENVTRGQELVRLEGSSEIDLVLARAQQELLIAQQAIDTINSQADLRLAQAELALLDAQRAQESAQNRYDANSTEENQAELDIANANLKLAKDAQAKMVANKGIDPDLMAAAEAQLVSAQASVANAQATLDALTLKANMDGTVIDLDLQQGQHVNAGVAILTIADLSTWIVKTDNLTEMNVTSVAIGEKVEVVLDALPDVKLEGKVINFSERFIEQRGDITYTVTILLTKTDPNMRWGMTGAVKFVK
jgi:multidrug resistance efflux pump